MGATFISITLDGKKSKSEITSYFKKLSKAAAHSYGHEYSGSWNMLRDVEFPTDKVFDSLNAAENYIYEKAEKWENAVCIRFKGKKSHFISPPTFNKKPHADADDAILQVITDYNTRTGYRQLRPITIVPADQLTAEEKATAIKLYTAQRELWQRSNAAMARWPEHGFSSSTPKEEIQAAIEASRNAGEAWAAFRKPIIERLWAKKEEPYEGWIMGGWAAQ